MLALHGADIVYQRRLKTKLKKGNIWRAYELEYCIYLSRYYHLKAQNLIFIDLS